MREDESVAISFTAKRTQLIGKSTNSADPLQLYELLTFASGTRLVSTYSPGQTKTFRLEFTVTDPAGVANEKIVFGKVYRETLWMNEGDE